jgi:hypothetical protein
MMVFQTIQNMTLSPANGRPGAIVRVSTNEGWGIRHEVMAASPVWSGDGQPSVYTVDIGLNHVFLANNINTIPGFSIVFYS